MRLAFSSRWLTWAACAVGVTYAFVTLLVKPSFALTAFGDIAQLLLAGLVTAAFAGKSRIERHRMVNQVLSEELAGPVHALAVIPSAPGEGEGR